MRNRNLYLFVAALLIMIVGASVVNLRVSARQQEQAAQEAAQKSERAAEVARQERNQQIARQQVQAAAAQTSALVAAQQRDLETQRKQLQLEHERLLLEERQAAGQVIPPPMTTPRFTPLVESSPSNDLESRVNELELREEQRQRALRDFQERQRFNEMMQSGRGSMPAGSVIDHTRYIGRPPQNYPRGGYTSPGAGMGYGSAPGRTIYRR
jgi:glucose/arabinose dehydrogenase